MGGDAGTSGTSGHVSVGNWGRWGENDERGALNLLSPEAVLGAARALRTGKAYSLAIPIGARSTPIVGDRPAPQRLTLSGPGDEEYHRRLGAADGVGANEDLLVLATHTGTHMDALSHVYSGGTVYNGHPAAGFSPKRGASRCGIEKVGAIAARCVLLDVAAYLGVACVSPGTALTSTELEACRESQGVEVRAGDAILVRTGWMAALGGPEPPVGFSQPGLGLDAVGFVRDHDVSIVGADNAAVEVIPFDKGVYLGVHVELLVRLGVVLLEHLFLEELAADRCYESLLVVGALPVSGATGSPVNPVAIG